MATKVIEIADFSGGLNVIDHQLTVDSNNCVSTSENVWAPARVLEKGPGWTLFASLTSTATLAYRMWQESLGSTGYLFCVLSSSGTTSGQLWDLATGSGTPLGYVTGSVTVTGISATGNGTSWNSHVSANDLFRVDSCASSWTTISSVEDATHFTLTNSITASSTTANYTILKKLDGGTTSGAAHISLAVLNNIAYFFDGTHITQSYDSTGVTNISAAPQAYFAVTHKSYIFTLRTDSNESRLQWSAINNGTSWPINNFIDIDKNKGKGTGLASYGNELIVFKTLGMFKIVGETFDPSNPTYSVYPIATQPGFRFNAGYSPVVHNGKLFFMALDGLYVYLHGTNFIQKIDQKYFSEFTTPLAGQGNINSMDVASVKNRTLSYKDFLFIMYPIGDVFGNSFRRLGIIDKNGSFWKFNLSTAFTAAAMIRDMAVLPQTTAALPKLLALIYGDAKPKIVDIDVEPPSYTTSILDNGSDTALAMSSTWISKEFNIGYGAFKRAVIYLEKQSAGNLTFDYSIDQSAFTSTTIDMTAGRGTTLRRVIDLNRPGSTIQIRLSHSTVSQTFRIFGIQIIYEDNSFSRLV